jgi:hypothetical protein
MTFCGRAFCGRTLRGRMFCISTCKYTYAAHLYTNHLHSMHIWQCCTPVQCTSHLHRTVNTPAQHTCTQATYTVCTSGSAAHTSVTSLLLSELIIKLHIRCTYKVAQTVHLKTWHCPAQWPAPERMKLLNQL